MAATQKVTVNLPMEALHRACKLTGTGVTATLILALEALERQSKQAALRRLRGKVELDFEPEKRRR